MSLKRILLVPAYPFIKLVLWLKGLIGWTVTPQLRVILYHDVPKHEEQKLYRQLKWISKRWRILTPKEFEDLISGKNKLTKNSLLITFDDGFKSCTSVSENILKPLNIKAIFFVVTKFLEDDSSSEMKALIRERFFPGVPEDKVPINLFNMSYDDLLMLFNQGHTIGAHTHTHARLSLLDKNEVEFEMSTSNKILQDVLGSNILHFAYTFGDLESFSVDAMICARLKHDYIYSGLSGNNAFQNRYSIARDSISPKDHNWLIGSLLSGAADWYFSSDLKCLSHWANFGFIDKINIFDLNNQE